MGHVAGADTVEQCFEAALAYQSKTTRPRGGQSHLDVVKSSVRVIVAQQIENGGTFYDLDYVPDRQTPKNRRGGGNIFHAKLREEPAVEFDNFAVRFFKGYRGDIPVIACEAPGEQTVLPA